MASRTVRVHLDPNMPRPQQRDQSGFGIPHLDQWITAPANQLVLFWHLLVLVLDWTGHGTPKAAGLSMRRSPPGRRRAPSTLRMPALRMPALRMPALRMPALRNGDSAPAVGSTPRPLPGSDK